MRAGQRRTQQKALPTRAGLRESARTKSEAALRGLPNPILLGRVEAPGPIHRPLNEPRVFLQTQDEPSPKSGAGAWRKVRKDGLR